MKIHLQMKGRTLIASLSGELDHHSAKRVRDMLEAAILERSALNLVFDFSSLTFMDSSGIGVIIGRYKLVHAIGGRVALVSKNQTIDRLITMSGLRRLMDVYETVELAVAATQGGK